MLKNNCNKTEYINPNKYSRSIYRLIISPNHGFLVCELFERSSDLPSVPVLGIKTIKTATLFGGWPPPPFTLTASIISMKRTRANIMQTDGGQTPRLLRQINALYVRLVDGCIRLALAVRVTVYTGLC